MNMGFDKQSSKGGVGGFLQMFDWNSKSRKKLFSNKSDLPDQFKQKKRCDGNFPTTRFQMLDEHEMAAVSSIKGSDYSCASSVTDEDYYATKAPGVVARLMGLDSMPKSNLLDSCSIPAFDSRSSHDSYHHDKNFDSFQDPHAKHSSSLQEVRYQVVREPRYQKVVHSPIEKFQSEVLPPKSAKSIPITHNKLLSPIKSMNFIQHRDAAQIMEEAARIIDPGPSFSAKSKLPPVGSSSGPLRVRDLKEKAQAAQKPSKSFHEACPRSSESKTVKHLRGQLLNKSWNDQLSDAEESISGLKSKGKSISLALQAKANVQKREGLSTNGGRSLNGQKETREFSPNQLFKSQSVTQKSALKKPYVHISSNVLQQNNQKQNCILDRGKSASKSISQSGKSATRDSSSLIQRNSCRSGSSSKVSSRRWSLEFKNDKRETSDSSSERGACKKQSTNRIYQPERNETDQAMRDENGKLIQSTASINKKISRDQDSRRNGTDIVSFTFTSPMTRSGPSSDRSFEDVENHNIFSSDSRSKRALASLDGKSSNIFPGNNVKGSDRISAMLEHKLKELSQAIEFSSQHSKAVLHEFVSPSPDVLLSSTLRPESTHKRARAVLHDLAPVPNAFPSSSMMREITKKDEMCVDNVFIGSGSCSSSRNVHDFIGNTTYQENPKHGCSIPRARMSVDNRLPSPDSVLEHHAFVSNCNSSETVESNLSTAGSKKCSSIHAQEVVGTYSLKALLSIDGDAELSDSASSTAVETQARKRHFTSTNHEKATPQWEVAYIKDVIRDVDLAFTDYALGRTREIINPILFEQMERRKVTWKAAQSGQIMKINRKVMFDCVSECLEIKYKQYAVRGCKQWLKGLSLVQSKDKLAEELNDEISSWTAIGDSLIDEHVDKDMSKKHGKWLDFETEAFELGSQIQARILNSLIDEVVADMLVL